MFERPVARPLRKTEFEIFFASSQAEKGWRDLVATRKSDAAFAWDFLTKTPDSTTAHSYRLKAELSVTRRDGVLHDRWQLKPSLTGTARIWYFIVERRVYLEAVHTAHPNQTK